MTLVKPLRAVPAVLLLCFLLAAGFYVWIRHSGKPWRSGERVVQGLEAPVEVRFDARGVPHISAERGVDVARALGWLHANDRRTQMELGRRAGRGRLAEALGESVVEIDVMMRTLRLAETADRLWDAASDESRAWLEAYAAGVSTWDASRGDGPPPGLRVLGNLGPWTPQDSLIFSLLMARDLSFWDDRPEEERFTWLASFGIDATRDLLGDPDVHLAEAIAAMAADAELAPLARGAGPDDASPGSNNWAVAASRAAGGAPMIANDPHLALNLPAVWYQVQIRSPDYEAAGMTLPGLPGVVIGRGPSVAWALTNTMLDDHDIFFEQVETSAGSLQVRRGEAWQPVEETVETIEVRGGEPIEITLRRTDRGVLLDADPQRGLPMRSLAWTGHIPADPLAAFRALAAAESPDDVFAATESYMAPAQNLVVTFASGELLYTTLGGIPNRLQGDGRLPSPGWDLGYGWDGLRPRSTNPRIVQPADGYLMTANHDIRPDDYTLPLSADFMDPFRAMRLDERLSTTDDWTRQSFAELQVDAVSILARRSIEAMRADGPFDGAASDAFAALDGWDGAMALRGASALWALVHRELLERTFGDEAEAAELADFGHRHRLYRLFGGEMAPAWWDDISTPKVEGRRDIVTSALAAAWADGVERWGRDVETWNYGQLHALRLAHRLDAVPVYGAFTRRGPYPAAGSASTVLALGAVWDGDLQRITYGPSMRWIVDWSQPDQAWAVLPGGQSGHPADRHYDDQISPYLAGELFPAPWAEPAIDEATVSRLRLVP